MTVIEQFVSFFSKALTKLQMAAVATKEGATIHYDGEKGPLAVGTPVFGDDGQPLPDGTYTAAEGGDIITVKDGVVSEITAANDSTSTDGAEANAAADSTMTADERYAAMEQRCADLTARCEDFARRVEELSGALEAATTRLAAMEAAMQKISAQPAGKPAHDALSKAGDATKTGIARIDNFAAFFRAVNK